MVARTTILRVGVDSTRAGAGARAAGQSIGRLGDRAQRTERQFRGLQNRLNLVTALFATVGAGLVVREFTRLIDTATAVNNRLRLVTNTSEQLNAVYDQLVRVSRETRTSLEVNANLFNRVALATRSLGLSYGELINFVDSLNRAIVISGPSAKEASNALIQLSQGLASNRLSGDELRSVLEQLPRVADVIAERLGTTRGGLRALARQGKVTADEIVAAFRDAAPALEREFLKIVPTIESAFVVLNSSLLDYVRNSDLAQSVSRQLVSGILYLADNFELLVAGATALAIILGGALLAALAAVTAALLANPFGLIVVGVAAAAAALIAFGDRTVEVGGQQATVFQVVQAGWATVTETIGSAVGSVRDAIESTRAAMVEFGERTVEVGEEQVTLVELMEDGWERIAGAIKPAVTAVDNFYESLNRVATANFIDTVGDLIGGVLDRRDDTPPSEIDEGLASVLGETSAAPAGGAGLESFLGDISAAFSDVGEETSAFIENLREVVEAEDEVVDATEVLNEVFNNTLTGQNLNPGFERFTMRLRQANALLAITDERAQAVQKSLFAAQNAANAPLTGPQASEVEFLSEINFLLTQIKQSREDAAAARESIDDTIADLERRNNLLFIEDDLTRSIAETIMDLEAAGGRQVTDADRERVAVLLRTRDLIMQVNRAREEGERRRRGIDEARRDLVQENSLLLIQDDNLRELTETLFRLENSLGPLDTGFRNTVISIVQANQALRELNEQAQRTESFLRFVQGINESTQLLLIRDDLEREIARNRLRAAEELGRSVDQLTASELELVDSATRRNFAAREASSVTAEQVDHFQELINRLQQSNILLQIHDDAWREVTSQILAAEEAMGEELTQAQRDTLEAVIRNNLELKAQADIMRDLSGEAQELERSQRAVEALYAEGAITVDEFTRVMRELSAAQRDLRLELGDGTFADGFEAQLDRLRGATGNFTQHAGRLFGDFVSGASRELGQLVANGEADFDRLARSIIASLVEIAANRIFTAVFGNFLSDGGGEGGLNLFGFQTGGSFRVPGSGGPDSVPIAFAASPGERVTVETPAQQRGGGALMLNVNVNNYASDQVSVTTETRQNDSGEQVLDIMIEAGLNRLRRRGRLDGFMGSYGGRRQLVDRG